MYMRVYKGSTKIGQRIMATGEKCVYSSLGELYSSWSSAKQRAFEWCWSEYCKEDCNSGFGVGGQNTFGFTASWWTLYKIDGHYEVAMRVETKDNSYIVLTER